MNIHWLQHVRFEGLGSIRNWAEKRGHNLIATRLWAETTFPDPEDVKMLIIMGGPMGVYDDKDFPLACRRESISLLACSTRLRSCWEYAWERSSLPLFWGPGCTRNREKEIGWFPVTAAARIDPPFDTVFPGRNDSIPLAWRHL